MVWVPLVEKATDLVATSPSTSRGWNACSHSSGAGFPLGMRLAPCKNTTKCRRVSRPSYPQPQPQMGAQDQAPALAQDQAPAPAQDRPTPPPTPHVWFGD